MAAPKFGIDLNIATPKVRYIVLEIFPTPASGHTNCFFICDAGLWTWCRNLQDMSTLHWRGTLYGLCRPEWFIFTLPLKATCVSTLSDHCLVSLIWHKSLDLELSYWLPNLQMKMSLSIYCTKTWNSILKFLFLIFLFF